MRPCSIRVVARGARAVAAGLCLGVLAACMGPQGQTAGSSAAPPPSPDYLTYTDHFAELQTAGLRGDYAAFAGHLKLADPATVTAQLRRNFRGQPFDVYTRKAADTGTAHSRMVELRNASGRLYLYLELDKVPGGWKVAGYELSRNEAAISAKL